ncbi:hypothetical protein O181_042994 [Austropuccinia psidii MF-1]|uniref:Integrase zinc-binding domain-containing protein n=1 Tax=Austropuccinia psidii MF-1 TaxID=1389203 RepID=A0A9Q3DHF8_9BASI|nr:hypothetical protein [Austropuccinia psidii MF-1]
MDQNFHILCALLMKDFKDPSLSSKLDGVRKKAYYEGRSHLLYGVLYHRTKHTCFITMKDRALINTILNEYHNSVVSGHHSEDRTLERVKTCSWWPNWRKDVSEYCQTCDRCQKANKATGKKFGFIIQIQEPKSPWEIAHMDWVTALPPRGNRSFDACLVLVDSYRKAPTFLPFHKSETAIIIYNSIISNTGLFPNIMSVRAPKCTSALWTNLHDFFGTKL